MNSNNNSEETGVDIEEIFQEIKRKDYVDNSNDNPKIKPNDDDIEYVDNNQLPKRNPVIDDIEGRENDKEINFLINGNKFIDTYRMLKDEFDVFINDVFMTDNVISDNLFKLVNDYNNKYTRMLKYNLENYKNVDIFKILNSYSSYIIKVGGRYVIPDEQLNDLDKKEELNDFLEIITKYITFIEQYIDIRINEINKIINILKNKMLVRYIIFYTKYGDLISLFPNKTLKQIINLNILPYISYSKIDSYIVKDNRDIFIYHNQLYNNNNDFKNIKIKNVYDYLNELYQKGIGEVINYNYENDPFSIPNNPDEEYYEEVNYKLDKKDIIIYGLNYLGDEYKKFFTYLIEIILDNNEYIMNNSIKGEIRKLKSLIKVKMLYPKILNTAAHNIYISYIIDELPINRANYFRYIFESFEILGNESPTVVIFLNLLSLTHEDNDLKRAIKSSVSNEFYLNDNRYETINDNLTINKNEKLNFNMNTNIDIFNKFLDDDKINKVDLSVTKLLTGEGDIKYKNLAPVIDFIKYNKGCSRIFYEIHTINDIKMNNRNVEIDNNEFSIIPVLGSYHFISGGLSNLNITEQFIPIRHCNVLQIQDEIADLKNTLGRYLEIMIIFYVDDFTNTRNSKGFKYQHLNYLTYNNGANRISQFITSNDIGIRKFHIPLIKLSDDFLTKEPEMNDSIYEEYNKILDDRAQNNSLITNFLNVKRIEVNIASKRSNYVKLGGFYLPLRIKDNETNLYLEEEVNKMQLISIKSQFNAPLCCFVWSIINTPNINKLLSSKDIEKIKLNYGKSYMGKKEIEEICKEYNICIEIKRIIYINGFAGNKAKEIKINKEKEKDRKITIGFIKYGSYTHYFPIFETELTKFSCKYLDLSNEEYYDIDAAGEAKIENYKIIEGTPRRNNIKKYANSYNLLKALIEQNKLEWASNFDNELFNYSKGDLKPNLSLIQRYGDIMSEKICYREKDYKKFNYICAADTETYSEENKLIPFCICCSVKRNDKYYKRSFYGEECQNEFLRYLCSNNINRVYFHNLKFDGWLFKNFMIRDMVYHASRLYSLKILYKYNKKDNIIELYDSLALIPSALRNFPRMFNLDNMEKELYPYNLINKESVNRGYLEEEELKNYFKEDFNEFTKQYIKNIMNVNDNKYDIKKLTIYYCQNDVDLLLKGLEKFEDMGMNLFDNISPLRFLTISSYSFNIMVKNCFNNLYKYKGDIKNYIRRSIRGGRCMVRNNKKIKAEGEIVDFDACSLYPSAMKRLYLPTGECFCSNNSNEVKKLFNDNLMIENQIIADNDKFISYMILHVKITKINKQRNFPLLSYQTNGINLYTNEMIGKDVYLTSIELEDFIEYQDGEVEFIDAIYWTGNKDNRMSHYIEKCYNLRREYKKEGNPLQEVLKLFMNSSYGKTIQKDVKEEYKFMSSDKAATYIQNNYGRIKEVIELNPSTSWIKLEGSSKPLTVPCHIGSLILGMSKRIMNEVMCLAEDNNIPLYYQDTDSMHLRKEDVSVLENLFYNKFNRKLIGSDMGQFHIDFPLVASKEPISRKSIFLGKKAYLDCLRNEDGKEDYFIRMKGVPDDVIINTCKDMNITVEELYERMYDGSEIDFNLLNSNKPKFEFTKDFQIMIKEKFSRKVKF